MAGERASNSNVNSFSVADFAHQNHIGVLAQNTAQTACEGEPTFWIHGNLIDACKFIFNWVFNGQNLFAGVVQLAQRRVKRGGFSTTGWSGDQHKAVRFGNQFVHHQHLPLMHSQTFKIQWQR